MSGELSAHNHGREYQVKVIDEDGIELLSEWTDEGSVARVMESLRKPQAKAYWLRERNITIAACDCCGDQQAAVVEYPLTDCLSFRSRPHDSDYLAAAG
jgi:hypothetical protein